MADLDVLYPGDYCVYYQDPSRKVKETPTQLFWAFLVPYPTIGDCVRAESYVDGDLYDQIDPVPGDLLVKAKLRPQSQGTCVLTGSRGSEMITQWIVPPSQCCNVSDFQTTPDDIDQDEAGFTHVANLITMRQSIYELFIENAFGIDVEDDFKIRIFHPSARTVGLPARLNIPKPDEQIRYFLREHFRWCLNVHFHGGSTEDDELLSRDCVDQFMSKVSAARAGDHGIPDEWKLKKEDWETQLGEGIIEFYRSQDLEFKVFWVDGVAAAEGAGAKLGG